MSSVEIKVGNNEEIRDGLLNLIVSSFNNLLSLKTTQLGTELMKENKLIKDSTPVFMWTLPNGTVVGSSGAVGDYFFDWLGNGKEANDLLLNPFDVVKELMLEIGKLKCELVGVE